MSEKYNLGGYDRTTFNERIGISFLEQLLLKTFRIIPYFSVNDRTPNLDGWFEICDQQVEKGMKGIPICRFSVQIKTINTNYCKNRTLNGEEPYKYSCDTKVVNAVMKNISLDPIILFLVDWKKEKVFWKYLSLSYCFGLNVSGKKSKTIYFSEDDLIDERDAWINKLIDINRRHIKMLFNKNDNIYMISDTSNNIPDLVQEAYTHINFTMEHGLNVLKKEMFPDVWKFGIAYLQDKKGFYKAGIYRVSIGQNETVKKDFDMEDKSLISFTYGQDINLKEVSNDYMVHFLDCFFSNDYMIVSIKYMSTLILKEIIFEELDINFLKNHNGEEKQLHEGDLIDLCLQKDRLSIQEYNKMKEEGKTSYKADKCMEELKKRGYTEIERVWKKCQTAIVGKRRMKKLNKNNLLNADKLDIQDEIAGTGLEVCQNEDLIKHENLEIFIQKIQIFYDECCEKLGTEFYDHIGKRQKYLIELDETFSDLKVKKSENFIIKKNSKESNCIPLENYEKIDLQYIQFSWYKLWRIMFKNMALRYLGINKSMIAEYIASI